MIKYLSTLFLIIIASYSTNAQTLGLNAFNPHYYTYKDKPLIMITSAEHYGGVVNNGFDYRKYFDALYSYKLNATRIYPGYLFEPYGKFIKGNTLGPAPGFLILPWSKSNISGGNKYNLDSWDNDFFARLKDFIKVAEEKGIIVEICFFNAQYADCWPLSPLYHMNNIQGVGTCGFKEAQTLLDTALVRRERDYVRKIVQEVNSFDNIELEICDEPVLTGTNPKLAHDWIISMLNTIIETEKYLPKKHLIAQQVEGPKGGYIDFSGHPDIPVIVTQYAWENLYGDTAAWQEGGLKALEIEYRHNKPIELNETNYYPVWYRGDSIGDSRVEAWEFIVGGGASFNQLNGSYTVENPTGNTPDNHKILLALKNLHNFMYSFNFWQMKPDKDFISSGMAPGVNYRGISNPGKEYAFYFHHSQMQADSAAYIVQPGNYVVEPVMKLPAGAYLANWIDPSTGKLLRSDIIKTEEGLVKITSPRHTIDIALGIKRK